MIPPDVGRACSSTSSGSARRGRSRSIAAGDLGNLDAPVEIVRPSPERRGAGAGAAR